MFEEVFEKDEIVNDYLSIADENKSYFSDSVISRGEDYFEEGRVENVSLVGNMFIGDVHGKNDDYLVRVIKEEKETLMSCDCPCEDNCKHEYATLLAIQNGEYIEEEMKPFVAENRMTEKELIKKIPAEALKKYLLSDNGIANTRFNLDDLEKTFVDYVPKQDYDYYYNNLYNSYLLRDNAYELYCSYYDEIKKYIDYEDYLQSFNIIKASIEVTHDLDIDITSDYPELGMYLRITYRKADIETKKIIEKYIMYLILHQYYGNCYLEDMIVHMN